MNSRTLAKQLLSHCIQNSIALSTAESCTGGLIAKLLTDIAGCSQAYVGGFITYTNQQKEALLGVSHQLLLQHTEVSIACAQAMARGAAQKTGSTVALSSTGVAGPTGGTDQDPIGTVYIGISTPKASFAKRFSYPQELTRIQIRKAAAEDALALLLKTLREDDETERTHST